MEDLIVGDELQSGDLRECADVRISPVFRRGVAGMGKRTKSSLERGWFFHIDGVSMFQPVIVNTPRSRLREDNVPHYGRCGEEAQKSDLGQPAEAQFTIIGKRVQPCSGAQIMLVAAIRERDPHIYIREKE